MKRLILCLFAIALTWQLSLQAEDFIKHIDVPSRLQEYCDWPAYNWCSFNDVGYSLPIYIEKTSSNNLYVTIYNNDWSVKKVLQITGLNQQDVIVDFSSKDDLQPIGYFCNFIVSQYFFNDDDKYEIVIGNEDSNRNCSNIRVINEDNEILGYLPDQNVSFFSFYIIGNRHYITTCNGWYSFPGQTGAPLMKHSNDTNGDGVVNAADVTSVYNEILGL